MKPGVLQRDDNGRPNIVAARAQGAELSTADEPGMLARAKAYISRHALVLLAMVTGALTHGYHLFTYPLYITDEGIYMEQAWSVLREGRLSPYTYIYDHAPGGWLVIAAWVSILPHQFEAFGNPINSGRALMLIVHVASVFLLFQTTYRLSHSKVAAVIATFFFNFSPLAVFYQRMVLLDNLMVFWVLLSLYFATSSAKRHVVMPVLSGMALGIGVVTKENAIFFIPAIAYLLYRNVRPRLSYRFGLGFWAYSMIAVVSTYFLYSVLKNELLPTGLNFNINDPPLDHASLLYEAWYQLHRSQGSIFETNSLVWQFSLGTWLPKDSFILLAGSIATVVNLIQGWRNRTRDPGTLLAGLLAAAYAFYLIRGSVLLNFYVVPLIPFYAMSIGILGSRILDQVAVGNRFNWRPVIAQGAIIGAFFTVLLLPFGGYFLVHNSNGAVVPHDLYKLPQTFMENEQIAFIRQNIPTNARIVMDDDLWVALHDVRPYYPYANSHWKAASDPNVSIKLLHQNWQDIDYIVMSNGMLAAMQQNGPGEGYILEALSHSTLIWQLKRGDVTLQVYKVDK